MDKILVFGGAGYIGSHTCKALAENGFEPVVYDNLSEGYARFVRWGDLIEADILDAGAVAQALERHKPVAIIHFAAFTYVGESVTDPAKYYRNNVGGSLNIAEAAHRAGNIPVIFSSSCATYGVPARVPIPETAPQVPINPYGRSKLMVEQILQDLAAAYGLPSVALRFFNACGADKDGEIGEAHRVETHLIPRAIFSGLGRIDDFCIFGGDYDTPDGSPIRDYIHVTDLADAHIRACRYLLDGGESAQFNIGTGNGYSVFELMRELSCILGREVPAQVVGRRAGDTPVLVAEATRARTALGFLPQHSEIGNILETALRWHRNNP